MTPDKELRRQFAREYEHYIAPVYSPVVPSPSPFILPGVSAERDCPVPGGIPPHVVHCPAYYAGILLPGVSADRDCPVLASFASEAQMSLTSRRISGEPNLINYGKN